MAEAVASPLAAAKVPKAVDERLVKLRLELAKADGGAGVDAFIIPSEDPHMVSLAGRWTSGLQEGHSKAHFWFSLVHRHYVAIRSFIS